ncbi:MAG TPA: DUF397 domain-containing protein, partial [Pseudonocardiaceae bacterium]|nr:DUF397 domain-containing protein [Pseudonocardiaceae bacterium]
MCSAHGSPSAHSRLPGVPESTPPGGSVCRLPLASARVPATASAIASASHTPSGWHVPRVRTGGGSDMHDNDGSEVAADQLRGVAWRKSQASNPNGDCVELAHLASGSVAVRNSRDPRGPALV